MKSLFISISEEGDEILGYSTIGSFDNQLLVKIGDELYDEILSDFEPRKYKYIDGTIVYNDRYIEKESEERLILNEELYSLKSRLDATDYKIIKTYEYLLVGLEEPYDMQTLHEDRQSCRDRINDIRDRLLILDSEGGR